MNGGWNLLAVLLALASWRASAADFTFAVEPAYPPDQAEQVYRPLLDYLGKATGHRFRLTAYRNYHLHWRELRENAPVDFVFEEAHFTDYRGKRFGFEPLTRTAEPTRYALIATPEVAARGVDGMVGSRIACLPSPSLGAALLSEMYRNPLAQPEIKSETASWHESVEIVFAGEAEAAMVPMHIAKLYPNLAEVAASREFPGAAISAASTVDTAVKQAVRDALLHMHEDKDFYEALVELGITRFQPVKAADYGGAERMLSGFFGYQAAR